MSLRERTRPGLGIIEPCLPSPAKVPPSGPGWLHEIKHDGFRLLARKRPTDVRLITRDASDFTHRFPFIEMAINSLPVRSCLIDGEAVVCDRNGLAVFELIGRSPHWVKVKNPNAPAVKREAEEDWGEKRRARGWITVRRTHGEPS